MFCCWTWHPEPFVSSAGSVGAVWSDTLVSLVKTDGRTFAAFTTVSKSKKEVNGGNILQLSNWWYKLPTGVLDRWGKWRLQKRDHSGRVEITVADSDLEVRVGRVGALLAVGPLGLGFGLKTKGRIPCGPFVDSLLR